MSTFNGARPKKFNYYHVYAAYSGKNAPVVRLILEHLRNANLRVCDPASELIPAEVPDTAQETCEPCPAGQACTGPTKQRCDICGNNVTIKDMNWHKTVEDQMVECSDCGMFMPPSFKSSHDMWVCRNKQVSYRDCGSTLSEGQIEEHGIQNHTVSRIERELYSTSSLPDGHEREECVPRDGDISSHDPDTLSTPSSCASRSNTPLNPFELGALKNGP